MSAPAIEPTAPHLPDLDTERLLYERYAEAGGGSRAQAVYYTVKPLIPRPLQIAMRRRYAKRQAQRTFPRWPFESTLVDNFQARLRDEAERAGGEFEYTWLWPHDHDFAITITHDVEGTAGIENIPRVLEVERRHGFVSSWNFCAEEYPIPDGTFDLVRDAGCEVGLHGIEHDDRMWRDRASFDAHLPKVRRYLSEWGVEGWRSPATHRNAEWMDDLGAAYDSSFPDSDPFEPRSGGCCSIWPYFIGDMVELPITLTQDHTAWEILRQLDNRLWREKTDWLQANNGLVTLLVHPDYVIRPDRLAIYDRFLADLGARQNAWRALPRDVAGWWRARRELGADAPGAVTRTATWSNRA
jgi:hypothetical protein